MANTFLNPSIVALRSAMILENILVSNKAMYRGYDGEFTKQYNGYKVGDTVTVERPTKFTAGTTMAITPQDITRGSLSIAINKVANFSYTLTDLDATLKIEAFTEKVIKPGMIAIANKMDADALAFALANTYNQTGTPGTAVGSYGAFTAATRRLNDTSTPSEDRVAILSTADRQGLATGMSGLYAANLVNSAWRSGKVGMIDGTDTYETQNVASYTTGARGGTPLVNGANQNVTYGSTNSWGQTQTLVADGATNSVTGWAKAGDTFTIAGVFAVNTVTKQVLPYLQQFVITSAANSDGSGNLSLTISPAIVSSGAFQNVSAAPADNAAITMLNTAATIYTPSLMLNNKAFALVSVPLQNPPTAAYSAVKTYKNMSVAVAGGFDVTNRISTYRFDVIYGFGSVDPSMSTRIYG